MKNLYLVITVLTLVTSAWKIGVHDKIAKASWLIGTWQMKTSNGYVYESWKKVGQKELSGKSYMLRNGDTIIFEMLQLLQRHDSLFYIPTVKKQNHGSPITFTLISMTDDQLVFKNPTHDFPQIIAYRRIGQDSLIAQISGQQNGKDRIEKFPMKKIKL